MKLRIFGLLAITAFVAAPGELRAAADAAVLTIFVLNNVTFADGGTATGSFVLDLTPNPAGPVAVAINITTTRGTQFFGAHYAQGDFFEIEGTSLFGQSIYDINAWVLDMSSLNSALLINFVEPFNTTTGQLAFPSMTAPTPVIATTAYPGEDYCASANQCNYRVYSPSGSFDPVVTVVTGKANCHGQSVTALVQRYGGLNGAAAALGYPSVKALQEAIQGICER